MPDCAVANRRDGWSGAFPRGIPCEQAFSDLGNEAGAPQHDDMTLAVLVVKGGGG